MDTAIPKSHIPGPKSILLKINRRVSLVPEPGLQVPEVRKETKFSFEMETGLNGLGGAVSFMDRTC